MKYAILHGNYNIYHTEFDNYEEAKEYYDHQIEVEGYLNDLQLCKILETHEAPEQEKDIEMTEGQIKQMGDSIETWKRVIGSSDEVHR